MCLSSIHDDYVIQIEKRESRMILFNINYVRLTSVLIVHTIQLCNSTSYTIANCTITRYKIVSSNRRKEQCDVTM